MSSRFRIIAGTAVATVATGALVGLNLGVAHADDEVSEPSEFTSMFTAQATPDTVVDEDGNAEPGEEGATGTFDVMVNSDEEIVCWDIELDGVTPPYESPADTATHIHESPEGVQGPPRLSFPDPEEDDDGMLRSSGCQEGPFTTGLDDDDGVDTGEGFTLSQIEDDPDQFYGDTHTEEYPMGAVRGQLTQVPHGGVDTGAGGLAPESAGIGGAAAATGAGVLLAAVSSFALLRRHARS